MLKDNSFVAVTLQYLSAPESCSYIEMNNNLINNVPKKWIVKEVSHIFSSRTIVQSSDLG